MFTSDEYYFLQLAKSVGILLTLALLIIDDFKYPSSFKSSFDSFSCRLQRFMPSWGSC